MTGNCKDSNRANPFNRISHGGGPMAQATIKLTAIFKAPELESPNFMTLYLLVFAKTQLSYFWHFLPKYLKNWTSKIFGGPRAFGKNRTISKFLIFSLTNPTFSSSIFDFFSTIISIEICRPLATKLRDLKLFEMAFQVIFSAKQGWTCCSVLCCRLRLWW